MNIVDFIVAVILLTPLIFGAVWYRRRDKMTDKVADEIVRDLNNKSRAERQN